MKRSLLIALLISKTIGANGQISFNSLNEIWAYADQHNIQIRSTTASKHIAEKNLHQAYGSLLPTVSANGSFTDNIKIQSTLIPANLFNPTAPVGSYTEASFGRRYLYNTNLTAQFDLLNTHDWFNLKTEKLNNELAALNIAKAKATVYEQLANCYFTCRLLSQAEILSDENLQTATALYDLAQNKFSEGAISEITLNAALINKEKAAKSFAVARENKELQLNNIRLLLNTHERIIISKNTQPENDAVADSPFAQDPEVKMSYTQMLASKVQWQASKATFAPTLSAVYQYNTQISADEFLKFSNSNTTPQQYWGLRLSLPIFSGNNRRFQIQKAQTDYDLKRQQYEATQLQSEVTNQNILLSYASAKSAFQHSKAILELYQNNDIHAQRKMNEGIISMDDRLKFYADLISSQNEYLQSLSDYMIQQYRLQIRQTNFIK